MDTDDYLEAVLRAERIEQIADPNIWITREHQEIPIREMTDRHLVHSVNMLLRAGSVRLRNSANDALIYAERFRGRGDLAEICQGASEKLRHEANDANAIVALLHSTEDATFQAIVAEAKRRSLWAIDPTGLQLIVPEERAISL